MDKIVELTQLEYDNLLFREKQIMMINELVDKLEEGEIDGMDFGEEVLNIL